MGQESKPYHKGSGGPGSPARVRHQSHVCALVQPDIGVLHGTNMFACSIPTR